MSVVAALRLPSNLVAAARRWGHESWLRRLPEEIEGLAARWSLTLGEPFEPGGQSAWVAPARSAVHGDVVLKVGWRHMESENEADGLREWDGGGTIRVLADERHDDTSALLLERCVPGTTLAERPEDEQDVVVTRLLRRLWRQPKDGSRFRPLSTMCDFWADSFERKLASGSAEVDPELAREGARDFRVLATTSEQNVLLCTDLHAENVLASAREEWLVIDPKPFVGDPTYDVLQHLLNCEERLRADPRGLAARMADLLELDAERLLRWLFARCVVDSPTWPWALDVAREIGAV
jgi:streptomycin 6-kinase